MTREQEMLDAALAEYDNKIDSMLDDARGVKTTIEAMEDDRQAAMAGVPGFVPATPDNPRPPKSPNQRTSRRPLSQQESVVTVCVGPCPVELLLKLSEKGPPSKKGTVTLNGVHNAPLYKKIPPSGQPHRILLPSPPAGHYVAKLYRLVGAVPVEVGPGDGLIDLRR